MLPSVVDDEPRVSHFDRYITLSVIRFSARRCRHIEKQCGVVDGWQILSSGRRSTGLQLEPDEARRSGGAEYHVLAHAEAARRLQRRRGSEAHHAAEGMPPVKCTSLFSLSPVSVSTFRGRLFQWRSYREELRSRGIDLMSSHDNLIDRIWTKKYGRPAAPKARLFIHEKKFSGLFFGFAHSGINLKCRTGFLRYKGKCSPSHTSIPTCICL